MSVTSFLAKVILRPCFYFDGHPPLSFPSLFLRLRTNNIIHQPVANTDYLLFLLRLKKVQGKKKRDAETAENERKALLAEQGLDPADPEAKKKV